jgi:hypothetical protein
MTAEIARRITCALLVLVLAPAGEMFGRAAIQTKVRPTVAFAPATVQIEVLIEADQENRVLQILIDSGEYLRVSTIALEGERAPRFHSVVYRSLPAGRYEIQVALLDQTHTVRAIEHHWINLVS